MPKLKINNRFWIIPNRLLNDPNISWKAKGLFWYLQSKPDDWDFAVSRICKESKDGEKATISWIKELEKAWYLKRQKFQNTKGHWDIEYILFDNPIAENRQEEKPVAENPHAQNPVAENRQTNKKRSTKKEINNKYIYIENSKINEKFLLFIEHRKQLKKPMTEIAIKQVVNKIDNWMQKYQVEQIVWFIERSIENGWQGIFENNWNQNNFWKKPAKKLAYENENREEFAF